MEIDLYRSFSFSISFVVVVSLAFSRNLSGLLSDSIYLSMYVTTRRIDFVFVMKMCGGIRAGDSMTMMMVVTMTMTMTVTMVLTRTINKTKSERFAHSSGLSPVLSLTMY